MTKYLKSTSLPGEVWRPIDRFPGYEVSNFGNVRSYRRASGPWLIRPRKNHQDPYPAVSLWDASGRPRAIRLHRVVLEAFVGPRPEGMVTRHLNGDPGDNRLENLTYGTYSENLRDAVAHGRHNHARRTHCPTGHPLEGDNLAVWGGKRVCRACRRAIEARRPKRQRGTRPRSAAA